MVPLLEDPALALVAAQSLGRVGHPAALETLIEQGLKRLGHYSSVKLDIESFRPYGADAEQALLSLLDYPNAGTREVVRRFLVEWPSAEGRRRLWAELNEAVDTGRAPTSIAARRLSSDSGGNDDLVEERGQDLKLIDPTETDERAGVRYDARSCHASSAAKSASHSFSVVR